VCLGVRSRIKAFPGFLASGLSQTFISKLAKIFVSSGKELKPAFGGDLRD
jgi:hypothetical protein